MVRRYKKDYRLDVWPVLDTERDAVLDNDDVVALLNDYAEREKALEDVIQMCFEDACRPSGKVSKKTTLELMKYADTGA
jgi:hypothetical protein